MLSTELTIEQKAQIVHGVHYIAASMFDMGVCHGLSSASAKVDSMAAEYLRCGMIKEAELCRVIWARLINDTKEAKRTASAYGRNNPNTKGYDAIGKAFDIKEWDRASYPEVKTP